MSNIPKTSPSAAPPASSSESNFRLDLWDDEQIYLDLADKIKADRLERERQERDRQQRERTVPAA